MKCEVCGGGGWYPIIDCRGRERYSIKCPECLGSGEADEVVTAAEKVAADWRTKYEAAMAEKRGEQGK